MVKLKNAGFSYDGKKNIFQGIEFSVQEGDILSILGPNGCGKTTLLKCINALFKVKEGDVYIGGQRIDSLKRDEIGRSIGYIPQAQEATFPYTVREMVLMGRSAHMGMFASPSKKDEDIADEAIMELSISHLAHRHYTNISGGEAQLVLIARALAAEPKVLLLDEPTSHLDFRNQMIILDVLEKLAKEKNIATIMTTHFPDHALSVSDRALLLGRGTGEGGRFMVGSTDKVITEDNLKYVFGIDIRIISFKENGTKVKTVVPLRNRENTSVCMEKEYAV